MIRSLATTVCLIVTLVVSATAWPADVAGRVFLDANRNGRTDAGEAGLAQCIVSDGRTLVKTDRDGRYRLNAPGTPNGYPTVVFVVNPPDTWPTGPWWTLIAGGEDNNVDFALGPQDQSGPLHFVQGTDIHLRPEAESMYLEYIEHVNRIQAPLAFVVHTGDLVVDALRSAPAEAEALFQLYCRTSAALKPPLRNVIGNHEHVGLANVNVDKVDADYGKGMYRRLLGPTSYAFRWGRYHFLALDGSTIDPTAPMGYRDALDAASADWADGYLKTVADGELVIVLVHQPLGDTQPVKRLLNALEGKRLLLTLWGHGHDRRAEQFGGALALMGGAVSSAWHGFVPYPPNPRTHVLFRLEGDSVEHVFLDWAAERSIDVVRPAWDEPLSGKQEFEIVVSDPAGSLEGLSCRLAGSDRKLVRSFSGELLSTGKLSKKYRLAVDTSGLPDGVYDMVFVTRDCEGHQEQARPVIVSGGVRRPLETTARPVLSYEVRGVESEGGAVFLNEQVVASLPVTDGRWRKISVPLPPTSLRRLNTISFRAEEADGFELRHLQMALNGRVSHDIRFRSARPLRPAAAEGQKQLRLDFYIDPTYEGTRQE